MNMGTIKIAPPNSIIFVCDAQGGTIPDPEIIGQRQGIVSTDSCAAVCCLAEMDGETKFTMGLAADIGLNDDPTYDGTLATPSGIVVISTVEWKKLLETEVPTSRTRLRIWTNRAREPDRVIIGLG